MGTKQNLSNNVESILGIDGKLSQHIAGFQVRDSQLEMAKAIAKAIELKSSLLAEAGTGTGKTFAYLIPALLSGKKVIISTATKNLQQQLIENDLPLLLKTLKIDGEVCLLKGRENYVCPQRLEIAQTSEQQSRADWKKLDTINNWLENSSNVDKAECSLIEDTDFIWHKVCARSEFCHANECSEKEGCFYPKIKKEAQESQVLVVNHHLFCADLSLRESGFGDLLPEADIYIFDEAHKLPDIASQFLGFSITRNQLDDLLKEIKIAQEKEAEEEQEVKHQVLHISKEIKNLNSIFGKYEKRWNYQQLELLKDFEAKLKNIFNGLEQLHKFLKGNKDRGKRLAAIEKRLQETLMQLNSWQNPESDKLIRWAESNQTWFKLTLTPLSVAETFSKNSTAIGGTWIFTSATLAVNNNFDYFASRIGFENSPKKSWQSPFNFATQGVIYQPIGLPDPKSDDYIKICLRAIWGILKVAQGSTFLLFTSYNALNRAEEILQFHWDGELIVQGQKPKHLLLEQFKQAKNAILLGTSSFWEGVDVRGDALKVVMIDRIPFIPPNDPVVQARENYLKSKGLNGFVNFQLPEAVIALKQGCGRLIRDFSDYGVLVLCDPRLISKSYGKNILSSLPQFPIVHDSSKAIEFLQDKKEQQKEGTHLSNMIKDSD